MKSWLDIEETGWKSTKNNAFNVLPTDEGLLVVVAMYFYAIYSEIVPGVIKA